MTFPEAPFGKHFVSGFLKSSLFPLNFYHDLQYKSWIIRQIQKQKQVSKNYSFPEKLVWFLKHC